MRSGSIGYLAGGAFDDRGASEAPGSALTSALLRTSPPVAKGSLPAREVCEHWQFAIEVLMWCDVPHTDQTFNVAPAHSFLDIMGGDTSTSIQDLADVTWQEVETALDNWIIGDRTPGSILKGRVRRAASICRYLVSDGAFEGDPHGYDVGASIVTGIGGSPLPGASQSMGPRPGEMPAYTGPAPGGPGIGIPPPPTHGFPAPDANAPLTLVPPAEGGTQRPLNVVELSTVTEQQSKTVCYTLTQGQIAECFKAFKEKAGTKPSIEEAVTDEQLTGLACLIWSGSVPYVDFSIWGQYQNRMMKRLQLSGLVPGTNGALRRVIFYGPPDFESFSRCYLPFRTGMMMLRAASSGTLDNYLRLLSHYHARYGNRCWALLYQVHVRAFTERLQAIRREAVEEKEEATAQGGIHKYDPNQPWEYCLTKLVLDHHFWRRELEESALLVLTGAVPESSVTDGNNPVASHVDPTYAMAGAVGPHQLLTPAAPKGSRDSKRPHDVDDTAGQRRGGGPLKKQRVHEQDADGAMAKNRSGIPLCEGFQTGACTETSQGTVRCKGDWYKAHQCAKCLSVDHGSQHPSPCTRDGVKPLGKGSKGGGKGKGKKGRR